jgi:hypothetical protein
MARQLTAPKRKTQWILASPVVCVQCIEMSWTKQSRGGPSAVLRNGVAEALPLPSLDLKETKGASCYFSHRVEYDERNDFAAPIREKSGDSSALALDLGSLLLSLADGALLVNYMYQYRQGAPERHPASLPALRLQLGQWGRVLYNGRLVDYDNGTWSYERRVYNIGLFAAITPGIFMTTEPVKVFSQIAHLW